MLVIIFLLFFCLLLLLLNFLDFNTLKARLSYRVKKSSYKVNFLLTFILIHCGTNSYIPHGENQHIQARKNILLTLQKWIFLLTNFKYHLGIFVSLHCVSL